MKFALILGSLQAVGAFAGGLVGYGIYPYTPYCAFACLRSLSSFSLSCTIDEPDHGGHHMMTFTTTPQCRAENEPWLTSLALCVSEQCSEGRLPNSELEAFWEQQATEDPGTPAKWSFTESLLQVNVTPSRTLSASDESLNMTSLVNPETWQVQYNTLSAVQDEVALESRLGIVLLIFGFAIPIVATWTRYVPYIAETCENLKPYLVYPTTIGTYHTRPLPHGVGTAPTYGQATYITLFVILNVVFSAVGYHSKQPHAWYPDRGFEIAAYVAYRTGVFALVLIPLMILFSSRNNFLLWTTNWSYSTYMILHRWVARLFVLYSLIHTLIFVALRNIEGTYTRDSNTVWWKWGAVATVFACALPVFSVFWVRRTAYETFLLSHIVMAIFVIVGIYYHIVIWLPTWGWQNWIYAGLVVWAFDRVARLARIVMNGVRISSVTNIGEYYARVDIPGVRWNGQPGRHVFCYFPTLTPFRPWENHPFSAVPTALLDCETMGVSNSSSEASSTENRHVNEKQLKTMTSPVKRNMDTLSNAGITLFVKRSNGMTKALQPTLSLPTLLEGFYPANSTSTCLSCDRIILIGGGIGITSLLPWVTHHPYVRLAWSVKPTAESLVEVLAPALARFNEKEVLVGRRFDIEALLLEESRVGWLRIGVLVSGPPAMCDAARAAVVAVGRQSESRFELEIDAFSF